MTCRFAIALLAIAGQGVCADQSLYAGKVIPSVECTNNPWQTYALYVPKAYTADRSWPILYCLDPGARGRVPVERFAQAAEAEGFIVAGSNNSRNGPMGPVEEAIKAMLDDTHGRFSIDDRRIYAAGHSGGARVALGWAAHAPLAGVVASGAGFGDPAPPRRLKFLIYAVAGVDDFNYPELYTLSLELRKQRVDHRFAEHPGGHEWLPENLALDALRFFNGKVPPHAVAESKEERRAAGDFRRYSEKLATGDESEVRRLVQQLRQDAAKPDG